MAVKKEKLLPVGYVITNIVSRERISTNNIKPGMFLYVFYRKNTTNDKIPVIVQRVVFVLNNKHLQKLHCLDLSSFTKPEFKRFYASYLAEDDPERFAELLSKDDPTVVENIVPARPFYKGELRIPLGKLKGNPYRTYFIKEMKTVQRVHYRSGNRHPMLTDLEVRQILLENGVTNYDT